MFWKKRAAQPHFVKDYEDHVANLIKTSSLDEAMSAAVGGGYDFIGPIEKSILEYAGLKPTMSLVDIGCGSGRLSATLPATIDYLGTDVVQSLLNYAKSKSPKNFRFVRHTALSVPKPDESVDMICAFSVFTHLHHTESYRYIADAFRALKRGGTLVFSFLEFADPGHWTVFQQTADAEENGSLPHLNMFIERSVIRVWAEKLGFADLTFIDGSDAPQGGNALGQSTVIMRKPR